MKVFKGRPPIKFILWDLLVALILALVAPALGMALYLYPDFLPFLGDALYLQLQAYGQFEVAFATVINYYFLTHFRGRHKRGRREN